MSMQIKKKTLAIIIAIFAIIVVVLMGLLVSNAYQRSNPTIIKPPDVTVAPPQEEEPTEPNDESIIPTKPTEPEDTEPEVTFPNVDITEPTKPNDNENNNDQNDPTNPTNPDKDKPIIPTIPVVDPDEEDIDIGLGGILEGVKITDVITHININGDPILQEDETEYEEAAREILTERYEIPELGISILTPNAESGYIKRDSEHIRSYHAGKITSIPNQDEFDWSIIPSDAQQLDRCICIIVGDKPETKEQNIEALINILPLMKNEMNGIIMSPTVKSNNVTPDGLGVLTVCDFEMLRCDLLADVTIDEENGEEFHQYMATYTFTRNGIPCCIIGYVYGQENDVELIHTLRGMMREMISSIELM